MKASDILPEGVNELEQNGKKLRKGSVAAFVANAKMLGDPTTPEGTRRQATADLRELVPVLLELGLFEVFALRSPEIQAIVDEVARESFKEPR